MRKAQRGGRHAFELGERGTMRIFADAAPSSVPSHQALGERGTMRIFAAAAPSSVPSHQALDEPGVTEWGIASTRDAAGKPVLVLVLNGAPVGALTPQAALTLGVDLTVEAKLAALPPAQLRERADFAESRILVPKPPPLAIAKG
jgi:hypothetical protein